MPKKSTAALRRRSHIARAALLATGGGGAQAQFITNIANDPALTAAGALPPRNDGQQAVSPAVPVGTAGNVLVGYVFEVGNPSLDDVANALLGNPMPAQYLTSGVTGSSTANVGVPLNTLSANITFSAPLVGTPTAPSCTMEQIDATTGAVLATVVCIYNPIGASLTFDPLTTEVMESGERWRLQVGYTVPNNPTPRHNFEMAFRGNVNLHVPNAPGSDYINTTIPFFGGAPQTITLYDSAGVPIITGNPLYPNPIPGVVIPAPASLPFLGPVADHQPVLIEQPVIGNRTVVPAGGNVAMSATFRNQGTAASTTNNYTATGFPAGATLVGNCTYSINGAAPTNVACNLTTGTLTVTGALPAIPGAPYPPGTGGGTIVIGYTVAIPAAATGTVYSIDHTLTGSNGSLPNPGTRVTGRRSAGPTASGTIPQSTITVMALATGGTQSVPALGPLALGGMGLMVALVPGFVAARRRKAATQSQ